MFQLPHDFLETIIELAQIGNLLFCPITLSNITILPIHYRYVHTDAYVCRPLSAAIDDGEAFCQVHRPWVMV
jgi:hypothetical protein